MKSALLNNLLLVSELGSKYILYKSDVIGQDEVMNAETLAEVELPDRYGFVPAELDKTPDMEARVCRNGCCR